MLQRLLLSTDGDLAADDPAWRRLAREFPSVRIERAHDRSVPLIDAAAWASSRLDLLSFDVELFPAVARAGALELTGSRDVTAAIADQVLTHFQALIGRRNSTSAEAPFDAALACHRALHDLAKPLIRADFLHARDAWQWVLRLEPNASGPLQLAALFHDIERLRSEADARVEHRAPDYQAFKDAHARAGAAMLLDALGECGLGSQSLARAAELVARHERPDIDPELALLNDADALSFFSLNATGYLNYFGLEQTKKKVDYTLSRLRPAQRARLLALRLPAQVRALVEARFAAAPEVSA